MTKQATFDYRPEEPEKKAEPAAQQEVEIIPPGAEPEKKPAAPGTEIAVRHTAQQIVAMFSNDKGLDPVIDEIRKQIEAETFDVTTEKGRDRIGSVARQIGSQKVKLEKAADTLTEDWRVKTKAVTSEKTRMAKEMDALRDKVLAPREEFQNRETDRVKAHEDAIAAIAGLPLWMDGNGIAFLPTAEQVQQRLEKLPALFQRDWQEFGDRATKEHERVQEAMNKLLAERKKHEEDQAELARLRAAEDERNRAWDAMYAEANTDNVAFTAAATAKKNAEDEAERLRVTREAEVQKEKDAAAERERVEKSRADKAESDRVAGHEAALKALDGMASFEKPPSSAAIQGRIDIIASESRVDRDWQEFTERAVETRVKVVKSLADLLTATVAAEEKTAAEAKKAVEEAATKKESDRIAAEQETERKATAAREADKAHRSKINNEALEGLLKVLAGDNLLTASAAAKAVVTAIAKGEIPHITVSY